VADLVAGCRSAPECELRDLVRTSTTLLEPVWNQPLPGADDLIPDGYMRDSPAAVLAEIEAAAHQQ
jgi:hypothetical protein